MPLNILFALGLIESVTGMYEKGVESIIKHDKPPTAVAKTRRNDGYMAFATSATVTGLATLWVISKFIAEKSNKTS